MKRKQTVYEAMTKAGITPDSYINQLEYERLLLGDIITATLKRDGKGKLCYITENGVPMRLPTSIARKVEKALKALRASEERVGE